MAPPAFLAAAKLAAFKPGRPGNRLCRANKRDGTPAGDWLSRNCSVRGAWWSRALAGQGKLQSVDEPRRSRRIGLRCLKAGSAVPLDFMRLPISGVQSMDEDQVGESLGDVGSVAVGAANSAPKYLTLCLNPKAARALSGPANPLLSLRSLEQDGLSRPGVSAWSTATDARWRWAARRRRFRPRSAGSSSRA